jgi:hypothetical protein
MNRATTIGITLASISVLRGTPVSAQPRIGTVALVVGAPRADVLRALREAFRTDDLGTDSWFVEQHIRETWSVLGSLTFVAGRLTYVGRSWNPYKDDDAPAPDARRRERPQRARRAADGWLRSDACRWFRSTGRDPGSGRRLRRTQRSVVTSACRRTAISHCERGVAPGPRAALARR